MIKRLFDLMAAGTALVILSPVLAVIAFLIRWDSAGPVFFRQVRIGRSGKPFSILKFRTMVADAEKRGGEITFGGDRRITAFGAFLRRYKLDELPQLINILRGDMSLVGPRPEVPTYVALWPEDVRTEVLSMRPGLTDLASIIYAAPSSHRKNCGYMWTTSAPTRLPAT
jgi:lipopolysaccharide/colanic/teichoic acid biosynthesis glycosyltransferase